MKRTWPIVAVRNIRDSAAWYGRLLDAANSHPGNTTFDQIVDKDGTVLLCFHHWGPSGLRGDHSYPSLSNPQECAPGKGLLLWFVVDDFEAAWGRAQALDAEVDEPPNKDNGTLKRAFVIRDPDGYHVAVNETRQYATRAVKRTVLPDATALSDPSWRVVAISEMCSGLRGKPETYQGRILNFLFADHPDVIQQVGSNYKVSHEEYLRYTTGPEASAQ